MARVALVVPGLFCVWCKGEEWVEMGRFFVGCPMSVP